MFEVIRVRLAVAEDGTVLALLGAEVRGPGKMGVELRHAEATHGAWSRGTWLRVEDLSD